MCSVDVLCVELRKTNYTHIARHDGKITGMGNSPHNELLYATGLRVSEAVGLQAGLVDLDASYLRVLGKGGRERIVPFGARAKAAIELYLAARAAKFSGDVHELRDSHP